MRNGIDGIELAAAADPWRRPLNPLPAARVRPMMDPISEGVSRAAVLALLLLGLQACFPHEPGARLEHFADLAPGLGEKVPDFVLRDLEGREVALHELLGEGPLVLQLGSYSCPVFRYRRFAIEKLRERYEGQVRFLVVYTQEAHPVGSDSPYVEREWNPWINRITGVRVGQTEDEASRQERARFSQGALELAMPMLVDDANNSTWRAFGAASAPAFVLDAEGRVLLRQVWVDPDAIEAVLESTLDEP